MWNSIHEIHQVMTHICIIISIFNLIYLLNLLLCIKSQKMENLYDLLNYSPS
nr:MAG TPA: hypothetical protein [Caudoviricetes sp.]